MVAVTTDASRPRARIPEPVLSSFPETSVTTGTSLTFKVLKLPSRLLSPITELTFTVVPVLIRLDGLAYDIVHKNSAYEIELLIFSSKR